MKENRAFKQTVEVGTIGDQYAEVLDGLTLGGKVVTSGTGRLRSGMTVSTHGAQHVNESEDSAKEKEKEE